VDKARGTRNLDRNPEGNTWDRWIDLGIILKGLVMRRVLMVWSGFIGLRIVTDIGLKIVLPPRFT
jgi:hypothetical protein